MFELSERLVASALHDGSAATWLATGLETALGEDDTGEGPPHTGEQPPSSKKAQASMSRSRIEADR